MPKFLACHTGLGDLINLSGAIKQLAEKELVVIPLIDMRGIPFPERKKQNVLSFFDGVNVKFIDWNPKADIFDWIDKWGATGTGWFTKRNCTSKDFCINDHIKEAYGKLGCNYELRGESPIIENVKKVKQLPVPDEPYAFVPEGGSTGKFHIDRKYVTSGLKVIVPPQDSLMLEYGDIIECAAEIHTHDCAWPWLINLLPTNGKLYFHKSVRHESDYVYSEFLKEFEII